MEAIRCSIAKGREENKRETQTGQNKYRMVNTKKFMGKSKRWKIDRRTERETVPELVA